MKTIKFIYTKGVFFLALVILINFSCERDLSEDVEFATFPATAEIFTDNPIGMGTNFYFPFIGSKPTAWSVDNKVSYEGVASMRFDIPNVGDPEGAYAGAIFITDGEGSGRDLSGFDALTFWAKGSEARTINEVGFGQDFAENKYQTKLKGALQLTTNWVKYIIPIPDASKLIKERGMFWYSEGPRESDGSGWTFWIDELKFEKLGTIAQPQPAILNGADLSEQTFTGTTINLAERGLTQTLNLVSGLNQTVVAAPSFFIFNSSNPEVATVNELGIITVLDSGTTKITATMAGVQAKGSLTLESLGNFDEAPIPTRDAANVISVFSDAYTNVPVDYFNGFFAPFQTTLGGSPPLTLGGGQVINYTMLNFVAIGTFVDVPTLNLTDMTHLHIDINVREAIDAGDFIKLEINNAVGNNETSGSVTIDGSEFTTNQWVSLDVPLADFAGLNTRDAIGLLFFVTDATISNIYVDNIYYYKE